VPAYNYRFSRPFGSKRRSQTSTTKDFLTLIPAVIRCSAYQRSQGRAMAANEKTFGGAIRERRRSRRKVRHLRGLGGGIRSLFRAELVLRRFLAPSRGPVSAAHFGISGPLSSREAETGFDSPGDWFAVATRRFHQLPRRQAAAQPGTPEPMPDAAMMSSPHPGRTRA
jgi:hypothetical protein